MMNFHILTLFPEMIETGLNHSVIKRAIENNIINLNTINIRDFSKNKHKKVDDYCYGGGAGMILQPQPVYDAFLSVKNKVENPNLKVIYLTPQGKVFNQKMAFELSKEKDIVFLCGHYEGIDQRVLDKIVTDEISIGDFILTGGELATMVIIDSVSRLIPNVLGNENSFVDESFSNNLLEHPQYTRPFEFENMKVPDVLISGHHKNIQIWKKRQALINTAKKRPDLLNLENLTNDEILFLKQQNLYY